MPAKKPNAVEACKKPSDLIKLAIRDLRASEELNPDDKWTQLTLAEAYRLKGMSAEAETHLNKALALAPGPLATAEANYRIADVYVSLGNHKRAVEHLMAASSQRPSGPWGKRSEDYLRRLR